MPSIKLNTKETGKKNQRTLLTLATLGNVANIYKIFNWLISIVLMN